jgi:transcription antitermination factor NusG
LDPLRPLPAGLVWYVLQTEPRREYQVSRWLDGIGLTSLVPLDYRFKLLNRRRGGERPKRRRIQIPLFPRCVFVGCRAGFDWLALQHRYVTGVLGCGDTPVAMRRGEIERLQAASKRLLVESEPKPLRAGGKAILLSQGLFHGHVVEIAELRGRWALVKQSWFGAVTEVRVRVEDLDGA